MQSKKVLRHLLQQDGISPIALSIKMGRSRGFINNYMSTGRTPSAALLAEIGDACGYDLLLRKRGTGEEIIIDPQEQ